MRLRFIAPRPDRPVGGVLIIYELAEALARRGHAVSLCHVPVSEMFRSAPRLSQGSRSGPGDGDRTEPPDWYVFDPDLDIRHLRAPGAQDSDDTDVVFGYSPVLDDRPNLLPVVLIQGARMLGAAAETLTFQAPCPKICVASWLVDEGRRHGVPDQQLIHISPGIRHDKYRIRTPIDQRPPLVTYCHNPHPQKGASVAIAALEELHRTHPDVRVLAFGGSQRPKGFPDFAEYRRNPPQDVLVNEILGRTTIFLQPSRVEGLGLPAIEAMACGAALVTTDNGGSRDYAVPGRTALVVEGHDEMVAAMAALIDDEPTRLRMAAAGADHVRTVFDWDRSARLTEAFLERYLAAPQAHGRP